MKRGEMYDVYCGSNDPTLFVQMKNDRVTSISGGFI